MPQWNASLTLATRHTNLRPGSGTLPSAAEVSADWVGTHAFLKGRLATVGLSVTVGTATPARAVMANVESWCTTAQWLEDYAASTNKKVAPQAVALFERCSAKMQQILDDPHIIGNLSGATWIASRIATVSGSFTDAASSLSSVGMENDVNFTRESRW